MKKNICIAVGGTGGHLFPAQHLATQLPHQVYFSGLGIKESPFFKSREEPHSQKIFGKGKLRLLLTCLFGTIGALYYLKKNKIDQVVGFGSYHSAPTLLAALILRRPILLIEQNVMPGRVNRMFSRFATTIVNYSETKQYLHGQKHLECSPLWSHLDYSVSSKKNVKKILVFGGSLGSSFINTTIPKCLSLLDQGSFEILHCTGHKEHVSKTKDLYDKYSVKATVLERIDLREHWQEIHLAIMRAGANSISEMIQYEVPSLLIPFPQAKDQHQHANAQFIQDTVQGGIMYDEVKGKLSFLDRAIQDLWEKADYFVKNIRTYKNISNQNCAIKEIKQWIAQS